jgi:N-acetylmuramoyl-L-alanine amidase
MYLSMIAALLLSLQVAVVSPPVLAVKVGGKTQSLPVFTGSGTAAVSGEKLANALGGSFKTEAPGRYSLTVGGARLHLVEGAPYVRVDTLVVPLVEAPTVVSGVVYLPLQVVSEIVPRFATGLIYDAAVGEVRSFAAPTPTPKATTAVARVPSNAPPKASTAVATTPRDATAVRPATTKRAKRIVVVDAGHGGPDNGMSGPIGGSPKIYEKHITLAVSKLVAQYLKEENVEVVMTRTKDTLIALHDRGRIANKARGDVFVSIHVNASGKTGARGERDRGFETYFLAEAKTEEAARVERMENEAVRFETGVNAPKGDPLSFIINDMAQNEHLRESNELAQLIQDELKTFHPGPNRGVQQANFAVLRGSFMPAVLVEIGFGTNRAEAAFISKQENQRTIAKAITKAIMAYLDRYEARLQGGGR